LTKLFVRVRDLLLLFILLQVSQMQAKLKELEETSKQQAAGHPFVEPTITASEWNELCSIQANINLLK
jgi:hypothetical protein